MRAIAPALALLLPGCATIDNGASAFVGVLFCRGDTTIQRGAAGALSDRRPADSAEPADPAQPGRIRER